MNIVRFEPWRLVGHLHREFDQLFGGVHADSADANGAANSWAPAVDVHEECASDEQCRKLEDQRLDDQGAL